MRKIFTVLILVMAMCLPALAEDSGKSPLQEYLQSEAFSQLLLGLGALVLFEIRRRVNGKIRMAIDMVAGIANGVEKGIPDETDSPKLKKIDKGLRRWNRDWVRMMKSKKAPPFWLKVIARGAFEQWVAKRNAGLVN